MFCFVQGIESPPSDEAMFAESCALARVEIPGAEPDMEDYEDSEDPSVPFRFCFLLCFIVCSYLLFVQSIFQCNECESNLSSPTRITRRISSAWNSFRKCSK